MRTDPGTCQKKQQFQSLEQALQTAQGARVRLSPYRCDLCRRYHLTGRTKGMFAGRKSDKAAP